VTVLDASAVLAFLHREPGADSVAAVLPGAIIGSVNAAEVLAKLSDSGLRSDRAEAIFDALELRVEPLTDSQARRSALFRPLTRRRGLSLGDRACLALAAELGVSALTTDRAWTAVAGATGVAIRLAR
jgi:PIN domain nuclease of toxin-antitoxin system